MKNDTPQQTRPAIGYTRVSTGEQAAGGISLAAQRARIEGYCAAHDLRLLTTCTDEGVSGRKRSNRPGLMEAIELVCTEKGTLVAYSLSRLARSTADALALAQKIEKAGAQLVLLSEHVDTTTPAGRVFYTMLAAFAQFEADLVAERTRMALSHKRERGQRWCNHAPYGFRFDGDRLTPSHEERENVDRMRELRDRGLTLRQVAQALADEGITNRAGRPFAFQTIASILRRSAA